MLRIFYNKTASLGKCCFIKLYSSCFMIAFSSLLSRKAWIILSMFYLTTCGEFWLNTSIMTLTRIMVYWLKLYLYPIEINVSI